MMCVILYVTAGGETFHPTLHDLVFCIFNVLGGHGMLRIGSVVVVSSEVSLKAVAYDSSNSLSPDLKDPSKHLKHLKHLHI